MDILLNLRLAHRSLKNIPIVVDAKVRRRDAHISLAVIDIRNLNSVDTRIDITRLGSGDILAKHSRCERSSLVAEDQNGVLRTRRQAAERTLNATLAEVVGKARSAVRIEEIFEYRIVGTHLGNLNHRHRENDIRIEVGSGSNDVECRLRYITDFHRDNILRRRNLPHFKPLV